MRSPRALIAAAAVGIAGLGLLPVAAMTTAGASKTTTTTTTLPPLITTTATYDPSEPYTPVAQNGGTDDYHCTIIDPHITQDSYILSSELLPDQHRSGSQVNEVHHAIYFLVSGASNISRANTLNAGSGGHGWTCFGSPLNPSGSFDGTDWLGGWAPGRGANPTPAGTGIPLPADSLIVLQMHYNLLAGDHPDFSSLRMTTTPQAGASRLQPLSLDVNHVAAPELPCVKGTSIALHPLCDRTASLNDLRERFGQSAVDFVNFVNSVCHITDPSWLSKVKAPKDGQVVKDSCATPLFNLAGHVIRQVTPHLHLIGSSVKIQIIGSNGKLTTLANVPHYNFDGQVTYTLAKPVTIKSGDWIKLTCGYDPSLRTKLPATRNLEPRWVTWGDGSSDEMCLGILGVTPR